MTASYVYFETEQESRSPASAVRFVEDQRNHSPLIGYLFWIIGFTGAHRFFFGKPLIGALWFFTGGLFLIGWLIDLFFIPSMADEADRRFPDGPYDYNLAWLLLIFTGIFGGHRFYLGKYLTAVVYLLTGGLFGVGYVYDVVTMNDQIAEYQQISAVRAKTLRP